MTLDPAETTPGELILYAHRGSIAHGTHDPDPESIDDIDTLGIAVPPISYYVGLDQFGSRGTIEIMQGRWDCVIYDLPKAINLLTKGNPNILSILWMDRYLFKSDAGEILRANRHFFATKAVYAPFRGYAKAQLDGLVKKPTDQAYMGTKRRAMAEKFGYDVKMASHLIRLLRQGTEFLHDGELRVDRTNIDANELRAIKSGEWTKGHVLAEAHEWDENLEQAYAESELPDEPNHENINWIATQVWEAAQ